MEDDLTWKTMSGNLSNRWSDLTQTRDLSLGYQTKNYKCFKLRHPQMEDNFKISKVEYLRNYWSDLTKI